jgi:hypothetical protein
LEPLRTVHLAVPRYRCALQKYTTPAARLPSRLQPCAACLQPRASS